MENGPIWVLGWTARAAPLFSRRIVGWRVDDNMEDALILVPLRTALQTRQLSTGLIVHSDRGGQYISNDVQELVSLWRIRPSMSRADDPYDNAFAESFWTGPPVRPFKGGIIRGRVFFERGRRPHRNLRVHRRGRPRGAITIGCGSTRRWATKALKRLKMSTIKTCKFSVPLNQTTPRSLNVHVNYLNRAVNEVTGKSTTAHIAERVLGEAKALLQHTDWNISDIAYALGYEYPSYFNNFFKKHTGTNPRNFRLVEV